MTTSVKVTAHCAIDKQVRIQRSGPGLDGLETVIQNGEVNEQVVYDGLVICVREEVRPALTEADALADLAGTPRPTRA